MQIPMPLPNQLQRMVQWLAATPPGNWLLSRTLPGLDQWVMRRTAGRTSMTEVLAGLPLICLTSYGAVSGQPRVCPLLALSQGERLILIASNFGSKRHPSWYQNLRKRPEAVVSFNGQEGRFKAVEAQGVERERYWSLALAYYAGYQVYAERAGRSIPIMVLEPDPVGREQVRPS